MPLISLHMFDIQSIYPGHPVWGVLSYGLGSRLSSFTCGHRRRIQNLWEGFEEWILNCANKTGVSRVLLKAPGARINASGDVERKSRSRQPGPEGGPMAYYKVLIEIWCDWDPEDSGVEEMVRHVLLGENSICTLQEVIKVVDRPPDIDNLTGWSAQNVYGLC